MLTELRGHLDTIKYKSLLRQLDHVDAKEALAAEAELAVLWAISRVAHMEPEPHLPSSTQRPDAKSNDLFHSAPCVVEVTAVSDDSFSKAMNRTANIMSGFADRIRKGAGRHLYFKFNDRSYYREDGCFHRERCVDPAFQLTPAIETQIRDWIKAADWPNPQETRITDGNTDVVIVCGKSYGSTVPILRSVCEMPPVYYHLEDNPIYKALKKKAKQVKGAERGTLKCVVLVDVGCMLLRHLRPISPLREIGGEKIIRHALCKLGIDVIAVVSPHQQNDYPFAVIGELLWEVSWFDRREEVPNGEYDRLTAFVKQLPNPQYEAREARDIHRQGGFSSDQRDWYLRTELVKQSGRMTVKLSAGLLHEYLCGRINAERFNEKAFGKKDSPFEDALRRGHSIRNIQFEPGGIDADDDYIVFDLDFDREKIVSKNPSAKAGSKDE